MLPNLTHPPPWITTELGTWPKEGTEQALEDFKNTIVQDSPEIVEQRLDQALVNANFELLEPR